MRYHVVSLAAALLALAVGVALGSGPLSDTVDAALGSEQVQADLAQATADLAQADAELAVADAYAEGASVQLPDRLDGTAVVIVSLPAAEPVDVTAVRDAVSDAGGTVTGVVALTDGYLDPEQQQLLDGLLRRLGSADLPTGSAAERAAVAVAEALSVSEPGGDQLSESNAALLTGLAEIGVIALPAPITARAGAVAVIGGPGPSASVAAEAAQLSLLRAFGDTAAATALSAPAGSAAPGGIVALLRDDARLAEAVASVDLVHRSTGVVITVDAIGAALAGTVGHYGTGPGATTAVPPPGPAPR